MILRTFGWSFVITAIGLLAALVVGGPAILATVAILAVLEISLSFDNAVVNATVLQRMSEFWQKMFLTVGVAVAVFGMRLVFPLLVVGITAKLGPIEAIELAINEEEVYAAKLEAAYPMIAAFGAMFLLLIFLDFVFQDRTDRWLAWLERPLARIGRLNQLSVLIAVLALTAVAGWTAENSGQVMIAGALGIATYIAVAGLGGFFESENEEDVFDDDAPESEKPAKRSGRNAVVQATGKAGFFLFLYTNVLDASFSFDGVIGAFAISTELFVIALGLGIGAMYIRSLTVFLVRRGTLADYIYLEHGAHWAIGALAVTMLVSISHHVNDLISGGLGVALILAAFISSILRNRRVAGRAAGDGVELESSRA
jgi:uncharacterized protein